MRLFTHDFVFSKAPRYRLARHGLFWGINWLHFMVLYGVFPVYYFLGKGHTLSGALIRGLFSSGVEAVLYMPQHMVFAYGIIYVLFPRFLYRGRYIGTALGVICLIMLAGLMSTVMNVLVVSHFREWTGLQRNAGSFVYIFMAGMRGGTTVGGFAAAIKIVKDWYQKRQALQQIEREKMAAELQLLKSQIHPHFLFNTLNNLYSLTLHASKQSPAVVLKLSQLLRYMLYEANAAQVPLDAEIAFLRNYIGLEQLRYGQRLDMSVSITGDTGNKLVAPLLLVPFLENAFKHGTSEQLEQAWMHLELAVQNNVMKFKLVNSREPTAEHEQQYGGIGLQNVRKRLELLYPGRHDLKIIPEEETFLVSLTLELAEQPALASAEPIFPSVPATTA
ncbi:sensor histidine kinase [Tellurirhabdus rosea]|uniref:sensor histidine kinase n=1 Tax=Tellurirhabdus rosea TaxID=2674997 RepID=UPI002251FCCF|nr:histidine kinase [Tellurirhabdus rosea]